MKKRRRPRKILNISIERMQNRERARPARLYVSHDRLLEFIHFAEDEKKNIIRC